MLRIQLIFRINQTYRKVYNINKPFIKQNEISYAYYFLIRSASNEKMLLVRVRVEFYTIRYFATGKPRNTRPSFSIPKFDIPIIRCKENQNYFGVILKYLKYDFGKLPADKNCVPSLLKQISRTACLCP